MDNRPYNIFFSLHTVSGIVISVLIYVIFFAGSFSFFRDEIINWERDQPVTAKHILNIDVDAALDSLKKKHDLYGRDISFRRISGERNAVADFSPSKDTTVHGAGGFFYLDTDTYQTTDYWSSYTLGEFLYRLHFFAQIPYPAGYYLSGFTALFLFFVVLTGVLIHWKKLLTHFFVFRPMTKLKTVWTDAHTVLGTIGLPFQTVYSITGAFFMIQIVLVAPNVLVLYNGNEQKLYEDLGYAAHSYAFTLRKLPATPEVNPSIVRSARRWKNFHVNEVSIKNYGDSSMHVTVAGVLSSAARFTGVGEITYRAPAMQVVQEKDPYRTTYAESVKNILYRIHFGDYGGYAVKWGSFLLGILSCFVVLSGILVWLEARNKKTISVRKRNFNERVGHIYLSICLSILPVTAVCFIISRLIPAEFSAQRQPVLYSLFFGGWLLLSAFFTSGKNNRFTAYWTLAATSVLGALIPVVHGITTGKWVWVTFAAGYDDLLAVDLLWVGIALSTGYAVIRMRRNGSTSTAT